ncbi:MAG: M28 family metallopeptidase [Chitinophagaceae bacterium]
MKKIFITTLLISSSLATAYTQVIIQRHSTIETMVQNVHSDSLKAHINGMVQFTTRHTLSDASETGKGIGAARRWVLEQMQRYAQQSNGRMIAFLDTVTLPADGKRVDKPTLLGNVMAVLKGTDPNDKRIFIISGHLDSRVTDIMNRNSFSPGANDDGSGVAAVMECARVMSKQSFPATIVFVAVSGEEQSLLGSGYLAEKAKKENWQIEAVLNNDIMGSNNSNETLIIDNTKLRVFSEGLPAFETEKQAAQIRMLGNENDGKSRQLARYVKEIGERYVDQLEVKLIYRNDRFLRGGDHTPFVQRGFAAVRLTEMNENFDHQHQDVRIENGKQYGDLPELMDFEYLRKNTAVNLAVLANAAMAPSAPVDVKIDVKNLTNSTLLYWKPPTTGKVKGYYVLVRETTDATWQKKFFTTATELRLPYSKDNYFFAVQSVGENNCESLIVTPTVGR